MINAPILIQSQNFSNQNDVLPQTVRKYFPHNRKLDNIYVFVEMKPINGGARFKTGYLLYSTYLKIFKICAYQRYQ